MLVISFSPKYEDRLNLFFREHQRQNQSFKFKYIETPLYLEKSKAYWVIQSTYNKEINPTLILLKEAKSMLGIHDLEFSYASNQKELYTQTIEPVLRQIPWFEI